MTRKLKSIIALAVAVVFAITDVAGAAPVAFAAITELPLEAQFAKSLEFTVPPDLGTIQNAYQGEGPTLIHIQTAHGNYQAQKKIQALLQYLKDKYNVTHLFIEGTAFKLEPEILRFFPDDMETTHEIVDRLAKKALVKGPELFLIDEKQAEAYGIENLDAYLANREAFKAVLSERDRTENFVGDMDLQIERLTSPFLNKDLKTFLRRLEAYEAGHIALSAWLETLKEAAAKHLGWDLSDPAFQVDWPMLVRLYKLNDFEKQMVPSAMQEELPEFLKELRKVPQEIRLQVERLLTQPVSRHQLPDPDTGLLFEAMTRHLGYDFGYENFPQISIFIGHLLLQSELNSDPLMLEMDGLVNRIADKLADADQEKKILSLLKDHRLLTRLFALTLTPHQYDQIALRGQDIEPSRVMDRFMELNGEARVRDISFENGDAIQSLFSKAMEFYRVVKQRDDFMIQNIDARMKEMDLQKAVVITGGFHAGPFHRHFKDKDYRYFLVSPKITELGTDEDRDNYVQSIFEDRPNLLSAATMESDSYALRPGDLLDPVAKAGRILENYIRYFSDTGRLADLSSVNRTLHARLNGYRLGFPVAGPGNEAAILVEVKAGPLSNSPLQILIPTNLQTRYRVTSETSPQPDFGRLLRSDRSELRDKADEILTLSAAVKDVSDEVITDANRKYADLVAGGASAGLVERLPALLNNEAKSTNRPVVLRVEPSSYEEWEELAVLLELEPLYPGNRATDGLEEDDIQKIYITDKNRIEVLLSSPKLLYGAERQALTIVGAQDIIQDYLEAYGTEVARATYADMSGTILVKGLAHKANVREAVLTQIRNGDLVVLESGLGVISADGKGAFLRQIDKVRSRLSSEGEALLLSEEELRDRDKRKIADRISQGQERLRASFFQAVNRLQREDLDPRLGSGLRADRAEITEDIARLSDYADHLRDIPVSATELGKINTAVETAVAEIQSDIAKTAERHEERQGQIQRVEKVQDSLRQELASGLERLRAGQPLQAEQESALGSAAALIGGLIDSLNELVAELGGVGNHSEKISSVGTRLGEAEGRIRNNIHTIQLPAAKQSEVETPKADESLPGNEVLIAHQARVAEMMDNPLIRKIQNLSGSARTGEQLSDIKGILGKVRDALKRFQLQTKTQELYLDESEARDGVKNLVRRLAQLYKIIEEDASGLVIAAAEMKEGLSYTAARTSVDARQRQRRRSRPFSTNPPGHDVAHRKAEQRVDDNRAYRRNLKDSVNHLIIAGAFMEREINAVVLEAVNRDIVTGGELQDIFQNAFPAGRFQLSTAQGSGTDLDVDILSEQLRRLADNLTAYSYSARYANDPSLSVFGHYLEDIGDEIAAFQKGLSERDGLEKEVLTLLSNVTLALTTSTIHYRQFAIHARTTRRRNKADPFTLAAIPYGNHLIYESLENILATYDAAGLAWNRDDLMESFYEDRLARGASILNHAIFSARQRYMVGVASDEARTEGERNEKNRNELLRYVAFAKIAKGKPALLAGLDAVTGYHELHALMEKSKPAIDHLIARARKAHGDDLMGTVDIDAVGAAGPRVRLEISAPLDYVHAVQVHSDSEIARLTLFAFPDAADEAEPPILYVESVDRSQPARAYGFTDVSDKLLAHYVEALLAVQETSEAVAPVRSAFDALVEQAQSRVRLVRAEGPDGRELDGAGIATRRAVEKLLSELTDDAPISLSAATRAPDVTATVAIVDGAGSSPELRELVDGLVSLLSPARNPREQLTVSESQGRSSSTGPSDAGAYFNTLFRFKVLAGIPLDDASRLNHGDTLSGDFVYRNGQEDITVHVEVQGHGEEPESIVLTKVRSELRGSEEQILELSKDDVADTAWDGLDITAATWSQLVEIVHALVKSGDINSIAFPVLKPFDERNYPSFRLTEQRDDDHEYIDDMMASFYAYFEASDAFDLPNLRFYLLKAERPRFEDSVRDKTLIAVVLHQDEDYPSLRSELRDGLDDVTPTAASSGILGAAAVFSKLRSELRSVYEDLRAKTDQAAQLVEAAVRFETEAEGEAAKLADAIAAYTEAKGLYDQVAGAASPSPRIIGLKRAASVKAGEIQAKIEELEELQIRQQEQSAEEKALDRKALILAALSGLGQEEDADFNGLADRDELQRQFESQSMPPDEAGQFADQLIESRRIAYELLGTTEAEILVRAQQIRAVKLELPEALLEIPTERVGFIQPLLDNLGDAEFRREVDELETRIGQLMEVGKVPQAVPAADEPVTVPPEDVTPVAEPPRDATVVSDIPEPATGRGRRNGSERLASDDQLRQSFRNVLYRDGRVTSPSFGEEITVFGFSGSGGSGYWDFVKIRDAYEADGYASRAVRLKDRLAGLKSKGLSADDYQRTIDAYRAVVRSLRKMEQDAKVDETTGRVPPSLLAAKLKLSDSGASRRLDELALDLGQLGHALLDLVTAGALLAPDEPGAAVAAPLPADRQQEIPAAPESETGPAAGHEVPVEKEIEVAEVEHTAHAIIDLGKVTLTTDRPLDSFTTDETQYLVDIYRAYQALVRYRTEKLNEAQTSAPASSTLGRRANDDRTMGILPSKAELQELLEQVSRPGWGDPAARPRIVAVRSQFHDMEPPGLSGQRLVYQADLNQRLRRPQEGIVKTLREEDYEAIRDIYDSMRFRLVLTTKIPENVAIAGGRNFGDVLAFFRSERGGDRSFRFFYPVISPDLQPFLTEFMAELTPDRDARSYKGAKRDKIITLYNQLQSRRAAWGAYEKLLRGDALNDAELLMITHADQGNAFIEYLYHAREFFERETYFDTPDFDTAARAYLANTRGSDLSTFKKDLFTITNLENSGTAATRFFEQLTALFLRRRAESGIHDKIADFADRGLRFLEGQKPVLRAAYAARGNAVELRIGKRITQYLEEPLTRLQEALTGPSTTVVKAEDLPKVEDIEARLRNLPNGQELFDEAEPVYHLLRRLGIDGVLLPDQVSALAFIAANAELAPVDAEDKLSKKLGAVFGWSPDLTVELLRGAKFANGGGARRHATSVSRPLVNYLRGARSVDWAEDILTWTNREKTSALTGWHNRPQTYGASLTAEDLREMHRLIDSARDPAQKPVGRAKSTLNDYDAVLLHDAIRSADEKNESPDTFRNELARSAEKIMELAADLARRIGSHYVHVGATVLDHIAREGQRLETEAPSEQPVPSDALYNLAVWIVGEGFVPREIAAKYAGGDADQAEEVAGLLQRYLMALGIRFQPDASVLTTGILEIRETEEGQAERAEDERVSREAAVENQVVSFFQHRTQNYNTWQDFHGALIETVGVAGKELVDAILEKRKLDELGFAVWRAYQDLARDDRTTSDMLKRIPTYLSSTAPPELKAVIAEKVTALNRILMPHIELDENDRRRTANREEALDAVQNKNSNEYKFLERYLELRDLREGVPPSKEELLERVKKETKLRGVIEGHFDDLVRSIDSSLEGAGFRRLLIPPNTLKGSVVRIHNAHARFAKKKAGDVFDFAALVEELKTVGVGEDTAIAALTNTNTAQDLAWVARHFPAFGAVVQSLRQSAELRKAAVAATRSSEPAEEPKPVPAPAESADVLPGAIESGTEALSEPSRDEKAADESSKPAADTITPPADEPKTPSADDIRTYGEFLVILLAGKPDEVLATYGDIDSAEAYRRAIIDEIGEEEMLLAIEALGLQTGDEVDDITIAYGFWKTRGALEYAPIAALSSAIEAQGLPVLQEETILQSLDRLNVAATPAQDDIAARRTATVFITSQTQYLTQTRATNLSKNKQVKDAYFATPDAPNAYKGNDPDQFLYRAAEKSGVAAQSRRRLLYFAPDLLRPEVIQVFIQSRKLGKKKTDAGIVPAILLEAVNRELEENIDGTTLRELVDILNVHQEGAVTLAESASDRKKVSSFGVTVHAVTGVTDLLQAVGFNFKRNQKPPVRLISKVRNRYEDLTVTQRTSHDVTLAYSALVNSKETIPLKIVATYKNRKAEVTLFLTRDQYIDLYFYDGKYDKAKTFDPGKVQEAIDNDDKMGGLQDQLRQRFADRSELRSLIDDLLDKTSQADDLLKAALQLASEVEAEPDKLADAIAKFKEAKGFYDEVAETAAPTPRIIALQRAAALKAKAVQAKISSLEEQQREIERHSAAERELDNKALLLAALSGLGQDGDADFDGLADRDELKRQFQSQNIPPDEAEQYADQLIESRRIAYDLLATSEAEILVRAQQIRAVKLATDDLLNIPTERVGNIQQLLEELAQVEFKRRVDDLESRISEIMERTTPADAAPAPPKAASGTPLPPAPAADITERTPLGELAAKLAEQYVPTGRQPKLGIEDFQRYIDAYRSLYQLKGTIAKISKADFRREIGMERGAGEKRYELFEHGLNMLGVSFDDVVADLLPQETTGATIADDEPAAPDDQPPVDPNRFLQGVPTGEQLDQAYRSAYSPGNLRRTFAEIQQIIIDAYRQVIQAGGEVNDDALDAAVEAIAPAGLISSRGYRLYQFKGSFKGMQREENFEAENVLLAAGLTEAELIRRIRAALGGTPEAPYAVPGAPLRAPAPQDDAAEPDDDAAVVVTPAARVDLFEANRLTPEDFDHQLQEILRNAAAPGAVMADPVYVLLADLVREGGLVQEQALILAQIAASRSVAAIAKYSALEETVSLPHGDALFKADLVRGLKRLPGASRGQDDVPVTRIMRALYKYLTETVQHPSKGFRQLPPRGLAFVSWAIQDSRKSGSGAAAGSWSTGFTPTSAAVMDVDPVLAVVEAALYRGVITAEEADFLVEDLNRSEGIAAKDLEGGDVVELAERIRKHFVSLDAKLADQIDAARVSELLKEPSFRTGLGDSIPSDATTLNNLDAWLGSDPSSAVLRGYLFLRGYRFGDGTVTREDAPVEVQLDDLRAKAELKVQIDRYVATYLHQHAADPAFSTFTLFEAGLIQQLQAEFGTRIGELLESSASAEVRGERAKDLSVDTLSFAVKRQYDLFVSERKRAPTVDELRGAIQKNHRGEVPSVSGEAVLLHVKALNKRPFGPFGLKAVLLRAVRANVESGFEPANKEGKALENYFTALEEGKLTTASAILARNVNGTLNEIKPKIDEVLNALGFEGIYVVNAGMLSVVLFKGYSNFVREQRKEPTADEFFSAVNKAAAELTIRSVDDLAIAKQIVAYLEVEAHTELTSISGLYPEFGEYIGGAKGGTALLEKALRVISEEASRESDKQRVTDLAAQKKAWEEKELAAEDVQRVTSHIRAQLRDGSNVELAGMASAESKRPAFAEYRDIFKHPETLNTEGPLRQILAALQLTDSDLAVAFAYWRARGEGKVAPMENLRAEVLAAVKQLAEVGRVVTGLTGRPLKTDDEILSILDHLNAFVGEVREAGSVLFKPESLIFITDQTEFITAEGAGNKRRYDAAKAIYYLALDRFSGRVGEFAKHLADTAARLETSHASDELSDREKRVLDGFSARDLTGQDREIRRRLVYRYPGLLSPAVFQVASQDRQLGRVSKRRSAGRLGQLLQAVHEQGLEIDEDGIRSAAAIFNELFPVTESAGDRDRVKTRKRRGTTGQEPDAAAGGVEIDLGEEPHGAQAARRIVGIEGPDIYAIYYDKNIETKLFRLSKARPGNDDIEGFRSWVTRRTAFSTAQNIAYKQIKGVDKIRVARVIWSDGTSSENVEISITEYNAVYFEPGAKNPTRSTAFTERNRSELRADDAFDAVDAADPDNVENGELDALIAVLTDLQGVEGLDRELRRDIGFVAAGLMETKREGPARRTNRTEYVERAGRYIQAAKGADRRAEDLIEVPGVARIEAVRLVTEALGKITVDDAKITALGGVGATILRIGQEKDLTTQNFRALVLRVINDASVLLAPDKRGYEELIAAREIIDYAGRSELRQGVDILPAVGGILTQDLRIVAHQKGEVLPFRFHGLYAPRKLVALVRALLNRDDVFAVSAGVLPPEQVSLIQQALGQGDYVLGESLISSLLNAKAGDFGRVLLDETLLRKLVANPPAFLVLLGILSRIDDKHGFAEPRIGFAISGQAKQYKADVLAAMNRRDSGLSAMDKSLFADQFARFDQLIAIVEQADDIGVVNRFIAANEFGVATLFSSYEEAITPGANIVVNAAEVDDGDALAIVVMALSLLRAARLTYGVADNSQRYTLILQAIHEILPEASTEGIGQRAIVVEAMAQYIQQILAKRRIDIAA
ncbi:MAG: hypothetical protein Q8R76_10010 [Candidatus Omnitrophota bacterium]|nr:hypothetical protein [Candidatus Omnitrophota bacterium]